MNTPAPNRWRFAATLLLLVLVVGVGCSGKKQDAELDPAALAASGDTALETYQRGMEYLMQRNLRKAREQLESVEYLPESRTQGQIEPLVALALADATFYQNSTIGFIDARNLYLNFVALRGDHPLAPYAQTQVGLCSLKQVNHPTKDQTQTFQSIADLDEVLIRYPSSSFAEAARGLRRVARSQLAEAEYRIGRFYLRRKSWPAAISRFKTILEEYPDFLEMDKVRFSLGKALVLGGDSVEGRLILDRLVAQNPQGRYVREAQKLIDAATEAFPTPPSSGMASGRPGTG